MRHELLGKRFGNLTVTSLSPRELWKSRCQYWLCKCDCGKEKHIRGIHLTTGKTISCGCALKKRCQNHPKWMGYEDISGSFFCSVKSHAKQRNIEFEVTIKDMWDVFIKQGKKCALTGIPISFQSLSRKRDGTASLDRIDNTKGYTKDNIQWLHKDINIMKMDLTMDELLNYCQLIIKNVILNEEEFLKTLPPE